MENEEKLFPGHTVLHNSNNNTHTSSEKENERKNGRAKNEMRRTLITAESLCKRSVVRLRLGKFLTILRASKIVQICKSKEEKGSIYLPSDGPVLQTEEKTVQMI